MIVNDTWKAEVPVRLMDYLGISKNIAHEAKGGMRNERIKFS